MSGSATGSAGRPIILYFPRTGPDFLEPPFGLLCLATTLSRAGFETHLVDSRIEDFQQATRRCCAGRQPLFFGVTAMTGPQIFHAIRISKYLKRRFTAPVVWGGLHVTLAGEQAIREPFIDIILRGYADHTIVQLAGALSGDAARAPELRGIPGILLRGGPGEAPFIHPELPLVDMTQLPQPDWRLVALARYVNSLYLPQRTAYLFTSRGCTHACSFCYSRTVHRGRWQGRTAAQVAAELDQLDALVDFETVFFHDDNFSVDRARLEAIVRHLRQCGKKFVLSANCAGIDDAFLDLLAGAGCVRLDFAVESGSPRILRSYNKGFDLEAVARAFDGASRRRIPVSICFILGHPEETRREIFQTLDFIDSIRSRWPATNILDIKLLTPYPGTAVYELCRQRGMDPPRTLEGWGDFYWNSQRLVWSPEPLLCQDLSFISLFAFRHNHLHSQRGWLRWVYRQLHRLELWRWERRCFAWPLELRGMHWGLRIYNRLLRKLDLSYL